MVIVRLRGGLGNQLFQYATGLRLALARNVPFKLDISYYEGFQEGATPRSYHLDRFRISAGIANRRELDAFLDNSWGGKLDWLIPWRKDHIAVTRVREAVFRFNPDILNAPGQTYLDGYWQSEKYFVDIRLRLLQEFSPCQPFSGTNRLLADSIANSESVALHVRRGDYVTNSKTAAFHGSCSSAYYQNAVGLLLRKNPDLKLFLFSDDLAWARENLSFPTATQFVGGNEASPELDLSLMRLCRYHIVANSTFSWWGAWLSERSGKLVIAPRRWFLDAPHDDRDLVPANWIRL